MTSAEWLPEKRCFLPSFWSSGCCLTACFCQIGNERFGAQTAYGCSIKLAPMSTHALLSSATLPATPLERALEQNETVQTIVEQSAAELVVIHAVLKQELPDHVQTGDVAHALKRTDALETKIHDTAQELAQVNEVLAHEIDERMELEQELAYTKAALVQARHQIA